MQRRLFSGLFLAVAFFCSTGLSLAGEDRVILRDPPPGTKALFAGDVLVTNPLVGYAKPSIIGAPNGDLYVAVEDLESNGISVFKSTDGGKTWFFLVGFLQADDPSNPSIAYGEHSNGEKWLYVAYESLNAADPTRSVMVFRFDTNGDNSSFALIDGPYLMNSIDDQVYPQIITDLVDWGDLYYVHVTYTKFAVDGYPVHFSRSMDRGVSWETPLHVSGTSPSTSWPTRPEIGYGNPAGLFITFVKPGSNGGGLSNQIWVTRSESNGHSFSPPVQVTATSHNVYHPSIAVAHGTDTVVVAFTHDWVADRDVYLYQSTDAGATWPWGGVPPVTFDHESSVDLAISDSNQIHAAYKHEAVAGGSHKIWYTSTSAATPGDWSRVQPINDGDTASGNADYPRPAVAVMPPNGDAAVAWTDARGSNFGVYFDIPAIFADGFESGNTSAWSSAVP